MAYTIYNTDGSVLLTLGEGKIDQKNTSLTLIGKNVNSYGEYFNNNLVSILGNFASTDEPRSPVIGQLWYDTASGRMKVYDLNSLFRPITNTIAGEEQPAELANNDFWWDTINEQIKFTPNGSDLYIIGPATSVKLGTSGWVTEEIDDNGGTAHTVTSLYNGGDRLAILSTDSFTFAASTSGMTAVTIGLNLNTASFPEIRFVGTATSADSVAGLDINTFVRNDINQTMAGSLTIENDLGLNVLNSTLDAFTIRADSTTHEGTIAYNSTDRVFKLQVNNGITGLTSALFIESDTKHMGVWNESPSYPVDIVGTTRITGQLIVAGTSTNITSSNVTISQNNIKLAANQSSPADSVANNGGIILHGTTDHKLTWKNNGTGWNVNDHANLVVDATTYNAVAGTSNTGTGATFTVVNTDGEYTVNINNTGTGYTSSSSLITWTTGSAIVSWTTATPYVNFWNTGTGTYFNMTGTASASGIGLALDIIVDFLPSTTDLAYLFNPVSGGTGYQVGELITITGDQLGGASPLNDFTFIVYSTGTLGAVVTGDITGTSVATWFTATPFISWTTNTPALITWSTTTPAIVISDANLITLSGTALGGLSPDNNVDIVITSTNPSGNINGFTYLGTGPTWSYKISSSTVITKTSLGEGIISAPGLSEVGIMSHLTVTNIQLEGNTIETVGVNQTLYLNASGSGTIDASNNKITTVATCTNSLDAANKGYVDGAVTRAYRGSFAFTLDVTHMDQPLEPFIREKLNWLYPISNPTEPWFDLIDGTRATILLASISTTTSAIVLNGPGEVDFTSVDPGGITVTVPPQTYVPRTTYSSSTWYVTTGTWEPSVI